MLAEALFWFHPLVWWIERRLLDEQERACDEEVLRQGGDPQVYAESILRICEFYVTSPLICVPGITGSDLKMRVREIMRTGVRPRLAVSTMLLPLMFATFRMI
jgi:beta-lactamase regulating signal transducer with metallopeptidase domain